MTDDQITAAARDALHDDTPPPPDALRARLLEARARGERVILPSADSRTLPSSVTRRVLIAASLVAAIGVTVLTMTRTRAPQSSSETFESGGLVAIAEAQEVPARAHPGAPPLTRITGSLLHAGHLEYAQRWTDVQGKQSIDSRGTFDVAPVTVQGLDAWRAVSVWNGEIGAHAMRMEAETLLIAKADLRMLARQVHASPYNSFSRINISQTFRRDSVLGQMTAEKGGAVVARRPIQQKLPASFSPFITEALAPVLMTTVDLSPTWRHSVSLLGWAVRPTDVYSSIELRVTGSESVTVPAGRFDCWRLELRVGNRIVQHWARKSDGLGVLTRDDFRKATKGIREVVLMRD